MPSFETARRIASVKNNGVKTIGQIHKEESDWLMEETWNADNQSKTCYIYDYLQFKPSQKVRFDKSDELYYFETDYKSRYSV